MNKQKYTTNEKLRNLPTLTKNIYANLPDLLKEISSLGFNDREKDCLLISGLTSFGAALHNVSSQYDNRNVHPNLYSFVIAPAGCGKGVIQYIDEIFNLYHSTLEASDCNQNRFFLPADTSHAAFIHELDSNDGTGLIFETEADELTNAFGQEWGDFSTALRKGFHHERISHMRMKDNTNIDIHNPRFGVFLSGTPNQLPALMHNKENGLVSRFMFYGFSQELKFKNVFANNGNDIDEKIQMLEEEICTFLFDLSNYSIKVEFTEKQRDMYLLLMQEIFENSIIDYDDSIAQIVNRHGLMCMKIAMILTILRNRDSLTKCLTCEDVDFKNAIRIIEIIIEHSFLFFDSLPNSSKNQLVINRIPKHHLYNLLPDAFTTSTALRLFADNGYKKRATHTALKNWQPEFLFSPKRGEYKKVK